MLQTCSFNRKPLFWGVNKVCNNRASSRVSGVKSDFSEYTYIQDHVTVSWITV